jgi:hypothetical protein
MGAWTLCAEGQTAVDQALALPNEQKAKMRRLSDQVRAAIEDAKNGKFGDIVSRDTWRGFDPFTNYRILGTAPLSATDPHTTTYVRFVGERGQWSARWVWRGSNAYVIRGDVLPLQIPLARRDSSSYEGYDLLLQRSVRLRILGSAKVRPAAIEVKSAAGTAVANRLLASK